MPRLEEFRDWVSLREYLKNKGASDEEAEAVRQEWWDRVMARDGEFLAVPNTQRDEIQNRFFASNVWGEEKKEQPEGEGDGSPLGDVARRLGRGAIGGAAGLATKVGNFVDKYINDEWDEPLKNLAQRLTKAMPEVRGTPTAAGDLAEGLVSGQIEYLPEMGGAAVGGAIGLLGGPLGGVIGAALGGGLTAGAMKYAESDDVGDATKAGIRDAALIGALGPTRGIANAVAKSVKPAIRGLAYRGTHAGVMGAVGAGAAALEGGDAEDIGKSAAAMAALGAVLAPKRQAGDIKDVTRQLLRSGQITKKDLDDAAQSLMMHEVQKSLKPELNVGKMKKDASLAMTNERYKQWRTKGELPPETPAEQKQIRSSADDDPLPMDSREVFELMYRMPSMRELLVRIMPNEQILGYAYKNKPIAAVSHVLNKHKNDPLVAETMAHEAGHLLKQVKGFWGKFFEIIGPPEKMTPLRQELQAVSTEMRGWPSGPGVSKEYLKYRQSENELTADAFAGFLTNPKMVAEKAPTVYKHIMDAIMASEELSKKYRDAQQAIRKGEEYLKRRALARELQSAERSAEALKEMARKETKTIGDSARQIWYILADQYGPFYRMLRQARKSGKIDKDKAAALRHAIEKETHVSDMVVAYQEGTLNAMKEAVDMGITPEKMGTFLRLRYSASGRDVIPLSDEQKVQQLLGFGTHEPVVRFGQNAVQGEYAGEILKLFSKEEIAAMEKAANGWWKMRLAGPLRNAEEVGIFSPGQLAHIKSNKYYVTQKPLKYVNDLFGAKYANFMKQRIGHFHDDVNPFHATLLNDIVIHKIANHTRASRAWIELLESVEPGSTRQITKKTKLPKGMGEIRFMESGRIVRYAVPEYAARSIMTNIDYADELAALARAANVVSALPRAMFVTYSPRFALRQPPRDILQSAKNVRVDQPPIYAELAAAARYLQTLPSAIKFAITGEPNKEIKELMFHGAIPTRGRLAYPAPGTEKLTPLDERLLRLGRKPENYREKVVKPMAEFIEKLLGVATQITEVAPKLADYKYMKSVQGRKGWTDEHIYNTVRAVSGTPDVYRTGHPLAHIILNNVSLFSNVRIRGFDAATRAWREGTPMQKANFAAKTFIDNIAPKIVALMAATAGPYKAVFDRLSDDTKGRYNVIPIGLTPSGKAVAITIPQDFIGEAAGQAFYSAMTDRDIIKMAQTLEGEIPYLNVNPMLQILAQAVSTFVGDGSPVDTFTGQPVFSPELLEAARNSPDPKQRREARSIMYKTFGKYAAKKIGLSNFLYYFQSDSESGVKSEIEKILNIPIAGASIGAFIKVSDHGLAQKYEKEIAAPERGDRGYRAIKKKEIIRKFINDTKRLDKRDAAQAYVEYARAVGPSKAGNINDFWKAYQLAWLARHGAKSRVVSRAMKASQKQRGKTFEWLRENQ